MHMAGPRKNWLTVWAWVPDMWASGGLPIAPQNGHRYSSPLDLPPGPRIVVRLRAALALSLSVAPASIRAAGVVGPLALILPSITSHLPSGRRDLVLLPSKSAPSSPPVVPSHRSKANRHPRQTGVFQPTH